MSLAGGGGSNGTGGGGRDGIGNGRRPLRGLARSVFGMSPLTPDQGCYGCLLTAAVLLVTLIVWGFIYWYNAPDFHDRRPDESAPTVQEQVRQRAAGRRPAPPRGKSDGQ